MTLNEYIDELIAFRDREEAGLLRVVRLLDGSREMMRDPHKPKVWVRQYPREGNGIPVSGRLGVIV
jgi:hypothetical protein